MLFLITIILLSLVEYVGDSNFKKFSKDGKNLNLIMGIIFYGLVIKFLIQAFKSSNLIYTNGMWDGISAVISTGLAFFLLHETLNNPLQWFGLAMIISGVVILQLGPTPK